MTMPTTKLGPSRSGQTGQRHRRRAGKLSSGEELVGSGSQEQACGLQQQRRREDRVPRRPTRASATARTKRRGASSPPGSAGIAFTRSPAPRPSRNPRPNPDSMAPPKTYAQAVRRVPPTNTQRNSRGAFGPSRNHAAPPCVRVCVMGGRGAHARRAERAPARLQRHAPAHLQPKSTGVREERGALRQRRAPSRPRAPPRPVCLCVCVSAHVCARVQ